MSRLKSIACAALSGLALVASRAAGTAHARELTQLDLRNIEVVNQAWNRKGDQLGATSAFGACNWYAVNKAIALAQLGFGHDEVAIAEVYTEEDKDHAIAEVKGSMLGHPVTFVLDNRAKRIQDREHLEAVGYRWTGVEFTP